MGSRIGQILNEAIMGNKQPKPEPTNEGINQNINSVKAEITNTIMVENDTIIALLIVILIIVILMVLFTIYKKHVKSIKKKYSARRPNIANL